MIRRPQWIRALSGRDRPDALRWSVVIAAPGGSAKEQWGDTWFARDLIDALRRQGQRAKLVTRGGAESPERADDDVVLVLRGLRRVSPIRSGRTNRSDPTRWLLWVISHPDLVEVDEASEFDAVFAASEHWSKAHALGAVPLLQATNPARFNPRAATPDTGAELLFVGSTRGVMRPIVRDAIGAGLRPSVHGVGWDGLIDTALIAGEFLPNEDLPAAYGSARVVLNDHWPDMAAEGFLSNRLFDASATGTRVISDRAAGITDVFGDFVRVYDTSNELAHLVSHQESGFPDRHDRLTFAEHIAHEHSFDARAAQLIQSVQQLRDFR